MVWIAKTFEQLSNLELYQILALRQEVFIVEQNCPYLDADGKDPLAVHCLGWNGAILHAYTRILPKQIIYEKYASIGRVITAKAARGRGLGKKIMEFSISEAQNLYPADPIKISAQSHLEGFYNELGFEATGEEYLEDNIPHKAMVLKDKRN
ncbi:MAG: GNAT family N-acetyltransferase [Saprospiraceae bacterium]|nr:GNAT family N-acetyltransferase [Saprospiraceae bacterium]